MKLLKFNNENINKRVTLNGYITPLSWDDHGGPTKFSLYTLDDFDIPLVEEGHLKKLRKNINQLVEITGIMTPRPFEEDHLKIIKLKRKNSIPTPTGGVQSFDDFFTQDWQIRLPRHSINQALGPSLSEVI
jgi:hypothetical protein